MSYRWILVAVAIALIGGCRSAPIYNVNEAPIVVTGGRQATMEIVKTAILRAGARLGWQMTETRPGAIDARIALRGHTANISVTYNTKTYSIVYRASTNLDVGDGNIHKNYNGWVENLDREIRAELLRV